MDKMYRLNLGCGNDIREGYINVDKFQFGKVDVICNLENPPYPWEKDSVEEIVMNHVLEHLGETTKSFISILQELYAICKNHAIIKIKVPHHRHDFFLNDPTHIRPITIGGLELFSKEANLFWKKEGYSNSCLALEYDVDFKIVKTEYSIEPFYQQNPNMFEFASKYYNNVIQEVYIEWKVIKDGN